MAATNRSIVFSSQIVHVGNGASVSTGGISASTDVSTALDSTNLARYPLCDITLKVIPTATIAPASNYVILYRRDLNIDGTNDEPQPNTATTALYQQKVVDVFIVPSSTVTTGTHYIQLTDIPLPGGDCEFYIENKMNANIPAGWTLKITPKTDSFA